ncbi:MAG: sugar ABC transporter ATP-binding protein [Anaerolineae bacterium]|nr:sugar ABC transporter ATP-binding protein [Anaerolineae bacterium]
MPLVKMEKITRRFGTITALEDVDFEVGYQEVVGLLGDNGAGKSTLIKVLTGVHPASEGRIWFDGELVTMNSPQEAHDLGIETVYQDLALVPLMSIARNFYLGREPVEHVGPVAVLDKETMNQNTGQALEHIGIHIRSAGEPVGTLSGGERQSIAIGRAVHFGTKLLILDEPTSALSIGETRKVISYTQEAKKRGLSVIFITHNIHHVFEVADRFTIISHGHKVGDFRKDEVTQEEVAGMIMGEPIPERLRNRVPPPVSTRPIEVRTEAPAVTADGTPALAVVDKPKRQMSSQERARTQRTRSILTYGLTALVILVLMGMAWVYAHPAADSSAGGVPALDKAMFVDDFSFGIPKDWRIEQSESRLVNTIQDAKQFKVQVTWDSAVNKGISPSAPLSAAAKKLQDDEFLPLKFEPGADVDVAGLKAYRYNFTGKVGGKDSNGVKVILLSQQNNFYEMTLQGPTESWEKEFKPLADAIIASIKSK